VELGACIVNVEANRAGVDSVVAECALAGTFLDVAMTSEDPEVMQRRQQYARRACDTALQYLTRVVLIPSELLPCRAAVVEA
jgi:hypothetical protein